MEPLHDYGELPVACIHQIAVSLPLGDLLRAASTCTAWHRYLSSQWQHLAMARWQHWATSRPAPDATPPAWREAYAARHKADAHILSAVADAAWPDKKAAALNSILSHGADALDVLSAAAQAAGLSGLFLGTAYRARLALVLLRGQLARQHIQQLLLETDEPPGGAAAEAAAEAAEAAEAAASLADRLHSTMHIGQQQPEQPEQEQAQGQGQGECSDTVLEAALQLNLALHPLADIAAVRAAVGLLGDELRRRMAAAEASPDSHEALRLLNQLLFGQRQVQPEAAPAAAAPSNNTSSSASTSSSDTSSSSSTSWAEIWPRDAELAADLSGFSVPTDGTSGLGLLGDRAVFRHARGSCMDSLLADRTGLPITLAILHRAVGRRAGLQVELVNMPGQILNRVQLQPESSSSSSSGVGSTDTPVFVIMDVFGGVELDDDALRALWHRVTNGRPLPGAGPLWHLGIPSMGPAAVCKRSCANLTALYHHFTSAQAIRGAGCSMSGRLLAAAVVQLGPAFSTLASGAPFYTQLVFYEAGFGLGGVFEALLDQQMIEVDQGVLASGLNSSAPNRPRMPFAFADGQFDTHVVRRSQEPTVRVLGLGVPIGSCVSWDKTEASGTGFVTSRQFDIIPVVLVLSASAPASGFSTSSMHEVPARRVLPATTSQASTPAPATAQQQAAATSDTGSSSSSSSSNTSPPWPPGALEAVEQAQRLLLASWFEPGFKASVAALCCSYGQEVRIISSSAATSCTSSSGSSGSSSGGGGGGSQLLVASLVLAEMCRCSGALGHAFEAAWLGDAASGVGEWGLVPNAFFRHKFPEG